MLCPRAAALQVLTMEPRRHSPKGVADQHIHIYIRMYVCMYVCMNVCIYLCIDVHMLYIYDQHTYTYHLTCIYIRR